MTSFHGLIQTRLTLGRDFVLCSSKDQSKVRDLEKNVTCWGLLTRVVALS